MIIVEPTGGLGNRMRVLASIVQYAKKINKKIFVIWKQDDGLNCPYNKIFKKNKHFFVFNYKTVFKNIIFLKLYSQIWKIIQFFRKFFFHNIEIEDIEKIKQIENYEEEILKIINTKKNIYIHTYYEFHENPDYSIFIPIDKLQKKINEIAKNFTKKTIGIHIRRTEHKPSIENSPTEKFILAIEKELKNDPETNFFLATDDTNEELYLKEKFGSKIITQKNKILKRNSIQGIQNALIDLYCLSKTKKIIGSFFSSFTETAKNLNPQIELEIIK